MRWRLRRWLRKTSNEALCSLGAAVVVGLATGFLILPRFGQAIGLAAGAGAALLTMFGMIAAIELWTSAKDLQPFLSDDFGIIIDAENPEPILRIIEARAENTPLARFVKCQIADERLSWQPAQRGRDQPKLPEGVNPYLVLRENPAGVFSLSVQRGPRVVSSSPPFVFYGEVYEWPLSLSTPGWCAFFTLEYALYRKEFYEEAYRGLGAGRESEAERNFLAGCASLRRRDPTAVDEFVRAASGWDRRLYPSLWGRARHNEGLARFFAADFPGAIEAYGAALEVRPKTFPTGWAYTANNLALALDQNGEHEKARTLLIDARDLLSSNGFADDARAVDENLARLSQPEPEGTSLSAEVEQARAQIRTLIGIPNGPFLRPGLTIAHRLVQASSVSGDFYKIIPRQDGSIGITLVDVEGHGLAASATAVAIEKSLFRPGANWGMGEARAELIAADRIVEEDLSHLDIAATMSFLEVNPRAKRVRYAGAGMPLPLLFRYRQTQPEVLNAVGMYVGEGYRRIHVNPAQAEAELRDGDLILIFTDGIPEAMDQRRRMFGQNGITAALIRTGFDSPEAIADAVLEAAARHAAKDHASKVQPLDDQAILVIQVGSPPAAGALGTPTLSRVESGASIRFELLNAEDWEDEIKTVFKTDLFQRAAQLFSLDESRLAWDACWEAIKNAIAYGSQPGEAISIDLVPAAGGIEVIVSQPQPWANWDEKLASPRLMPILEDPDFGTRMMLENSKEVTVSGHGRRVHLGFSAPDLQAKIKGGGYERAV